VLIPIVNLWWPYETVCDLYPPGGAPRLVLRWWISYVLVDFVAGFGVFIAALTGSVPVSVVGAAFLVVTPAASGWRVADLTAVQRTNVDLAVGLLGTIQSEREQQVLVQLHPHRVVRVDAR
jgi:hypothetical protein